MRRSFSLSQLNSTHYQSVAFITPHRLGDALFTTPAIRELKRQIPDIEITILATSQAAHEVYLGNPHIKAAYDCSEGVPTEVKEAHLDLTLAGLGNERSLSVSNTLNGACHFFVGTRISLKGQPRPRFKTGGADKNEAIIHATQNHINKFTRRFQLESPCCDFSDNLPITPQDTEFAKKKLQDLGIHQDQRLVGLHIGCRNIQKSKFFGLRKKELTNSRAWRMKEVIEFSGRLAKHDPQARGILTGTGGEAPLNAHLQKVCSNLIDLSNQFSIKQSAALVNELDAFICTDTGMQHIASSTSTPLIGLFGVTNPVDTGPYPGRKQTTIIEADNMDMTRGSEVFLAYSETLKNHH